MIYIIDMAKTKKKAVLIYLEQGQVAGLDALSKKMNISKAALIRESVEKYLNKLPVEDDPAFDIIAIGQSGKSDLSVKHDQYMRKSLRKRKK